MSHPLNTVAAHAHHLIPAGRTARRGGLGRGPAEPRPRRRQRRACGPLLLPRPSEVQMGPVPRVRVVPRADLLHRSEDGQTALRRPRRGQDRVRDRHPQRSQSSSTRHAKTRTNGYAESPTDSPATSTGATCMSSSTNSTAIRCPTTGSNCPRVCSAGCSPPHRTRTLRNGRRRKLSTSTPSAATRACATSLATGRHADLSHSGTRQQDRLVADGIGRGGRRRTRAGSHRAPQKACVVLNCRREGLHAAVVSSQGYEHVRSIHESLGADQGQP